MTSVVKTKKLTKKAITPTYGTPYSAGADLYNAEEYPISIAPGETRLIHTGLSFEIPEGCVGLIFARSGLATKRGLAPANKVGVIDSDYRGEVMVSLFNQSGKTQTVEYGERLAQLAIVPFIKADFEISDELSETVRGRGGFGSTGMK